MGSRDLTDRTVFPGEIGHQEIDGYHGWCPVEYQAFGTEIQFIERLVQINLDQTALPGIGQTHVTLILHIVTIRVQLLVFDGARQAQITAATPNKIIISPHERHQDRCCSRQIDHGRPDRIMHQLPGRRRSTVTIAVWQTSGFR